MDSNMETTRLFPQWKEACKEVAALDYGASITRARMIELLDLKEPRTVSEVASFQFEYLAGTDRLKRELLNEHKKLLVSVRGDGYRIIPPSEQTSHAMRAGTRELGKALIRMQSSVVKTNLALLDSEQRKENANALAKIDSLAGSKKRIWKD